ncbi:hypothetical protein S40293_10743 [Stachybotrys chartarum IBT 40293]|nr:hypothetical protein S40293_10743 [Stachybotrys chartarum IBT 40293]
MWLPTRKVYQTIIGHARMNASDQDEYPDGIAELVVTALGTNGRHYLCWKTRSGAYRQHRHGLPETLDDWLFPSDGSTRHFPTLQVVLSGEESFWASDKDGQIRNAIPESARELQREKTPGHAPPIESLPQRRWRCAVGIDGCRDDEVEEEKYVDDCADAECRRVGGTEGAGQSTVTANPSSHVLQQRRNPQEPVQLQLPRESYQSQEQHRSGIPVHRRRGANGGALEPAVLHGVNAGVQLAGRGISHAREAVFHSTMPHVGGAEGR